MTSISTIEFLRRLRDSILQPQSEARFSFFLGAGCSVSSGIPDASTLVQHFWLPRLKSILTGSQTTDAQWESKIFPNYDPEHPATIYAQVIERLFLTVEERQGEIDRLCQSRDPGFGYSVLAQLVADNNLGRHFNLILTTNFDDLAADAIYLYTNKKPLVIAHESLANFIRVGRNKPLIVKLHGDAKLAPRNTHMEVASLDESLSEATTLLLKESGIIFIGYGGRDQSILKIFSQLAEDSLPWGIYWVNQDPPSPEFTKLLDKRGAIHVKQSDFDQLAFLMQRLFQLKHPSRDRFDHLLTSYLQTLSELELKASSEAQTDRRTIDLGPNLLDWQSPLAEASRLEASNPERALEIYEATLDKFPVVPEVLSSLGSFLGRQYPERSNEAKMLFDRANKIAPQNQSILLMYSTFLKNVRQEYDEAEKLLKTAFKLAPNDSRVLGAYGIFKDTVQRDYAGAESFFEKALAIDPNYSSLMLVYGLMLMGLRRNLDRAEELLKRASELNLSPLNSVVYAIFQSDIRGNHLRAGASLAVTLEVFPNDIDVLIGYSSFLFRHKRNPSKARQLIEKALALFPSDQSANLILAMLDWHENNPDNAKQIIDKLLTSTNPSEQLTALFYSYVFQTDPCRRESTVKTIYSLIRSGKRNLELTFDQNLIELLRIPKDDADYLTRLCDVITDRTDAVSLEALQGGGR
jgi:tetratricopeptide (TPR) repeat protein